MRAPVNFDALAPTYDATRGADQWMLDRFLARLPLGRDTVVLEFGCGTGNQLAAQQARCGCRGIGVDPSAGMQAVARTKGLDVRHGDHARIPLADGTVDFAFACDVVHHVADLDAMFAQLHRVLRSGSPFAIRTRSHPQLRAALFNRWFPSLAQIDCARYPSLEALRDAASRHGFAADGDEVMSFMQLDIVDATLVTNIELKNWPHLRLLPEHEYEIGLAQLRAALGQRFDSPGAGQTLLWFKRGVKAAQ